MAELKNLSDFLEFQADTGVQSGEKCRTCGAPAVKRYRRTDGKPFWGCSQFFDGGCRGVHEHPDPPDPSKIQPRPPAGSPMGPIPPAPIVTQMVPALARKKPPHLSKAVQKAKRKRDRKRDRRKEDKKQQILKPQPPPDPVLTEEDKAEMREALRGGVLDQFDW